jgi:hypothetical protein
MRTEGTDRPPRCTDAWTVECPVRFERARNGRKRLLTSDATPPSAPLPPGRVPRVARLLALAHRFEERLRSGEIKNHAELALIAGVSRSRVTQILDFLHLAVEIQQSIFDLPLTHKGHDPVSERDLRPIAAIPEWSKQMERWKNIIG